MLSSDRRTKSSETSRHSWSARVLVLLGVLVAAPWSCGDPTAPVDTAGWLEVAPGEVLLTAAGDTARLTATLRAEDGSVIAEPIGWRTNDASVAGVSTTGLVTAVAPGSVEITASARGLEAVVAVEVWIAPAVSAYLPGEVYRGRRDYVEYHPGTLPIVLAGPHGGRLTPAEIPDRSWGVTVMDRNTAELAEGVADALEMLTGERPHMVLSWLHRSKLDPNREVVEAAQGSVFAEHAWGEYHGFVTTARATIEGTHGSGLFIDMHGHGHPIARVELGYLLSSTTLSQPNATLDLQASSSSLRHLVESSGSTLSTLVRGPSSLGTLLEDRGVPSVPSSATPDPGDDPFFSGGYSTAVHGSRGGGTVSGIQLEHHYPGLRDSEANRAAYATALAEALVGYLDSHFRIRIP